MFEILQSHGITYGVIALIIIIAIIVVLIGMFWQYVAIGSVGLFCVYAIAMGIIPDKKDKPEVKQETLVEQTIKSPEVPKEYIEDCKRYTEKTKDECITLWNERADND